VPGPRPPLGFLSIGFRPFFLAAGLWAVVAVAVWLCMLTGELSLPSRFTPLEWHIHEMLFGFVMAGVAGFLLTAIPNWTGRRPVHGWGLGLLFGLWGFGRAACLVSGWMPAWLSVIADLSFPAALLGVVAHEIVAARNRRNMPIIIPVGLFGMANASMHLEALDFGVPPGLGWRVGLISALILISVIGGRVVPAFTRNWLVRQGSAREPAAQSLVDRTALGLLHAGLLAWAVAPDLRPLGYLLVAAGVLNAWRLARWRGEATLGEPLLLVLHVGYALLAVGVILLGVSLLVPSVPITAAIHALTMGGIATMILAMMTRATRGHSGRALTADPATTAIYALVTLATVTRIGAAWAGALFMPLLVSSALCWIAAFSLFCIAYANMLVLPAKQASPS
jgi:uncharacterized protein involved in response to NO